MEKYQPSQNGKIPGYLNARWPAVCTLLCSSLVSVSLPSAPYKIPISWDQGIFPLSAITLELSKLCGSFRICCISPKWGWFRVHRTRIFCWRLKIQIICSMVVSPKCKRCQTLTSNKMHKESRKGQCTFPWSGTLGKFASQGFYDIDNLWSISSAQSWTNSLQTRKKIVG